MSRARRRRRVEDPRREPGVGLGLALPRGPALLGLTPLLGAARRILAGLGGPVSVAAPLLVRLRDLVGREETGGEVAQVHGRGRGGRSGRRSRTRRLDDGERARLLLAGPLLAGPLFAGRPVLAGPVLARPVLARPVH